MLYEVITVGIPFEKQDRGLTLALGGFTTGVSPLCLANSFTPFANGGYYSYPSCITKIENGMGEIIYKRPNTKTSVLSSQTAFLITSMLKSAAATGTALNIIRLSLSRITSYNVCYTKLLR